MTLVSSVPALLLLSCALVLAVGLACLGQLLVHRRFRRQSFIEHNEVGGVIFTGAGKRGLRNDPSGAFTLTGANVPSLLGSAGAARHFIV